MNAFSVLLASVVCVLLSGATSLGADKIMLGKPVERVIDGERKNIFGNPGTGAWFQYEFSARLKAGQSIRISATVVGKGRLVNVAVADPRGNVIEPGTPRIVKSIEVDLEEVNATGDYKILVLSDLVGPFTLRVVDAGEDEDSVESLEAKIAEMTKQINDLENRLKAAKARRNGK